MTTKPTTGGGIFGCCCWPQADKMRCEQQGDNATAQHEIPSINKAPAGGAPIADRELQNPRISGLNKGGLPELEGVVGPKCWSRRRFQRVERRQFDTVGTFTLAV